MVGDSGALVLLPWSDGGNLEVAVRRVGLRLGEGCWVCSPLPPPGPGPGRGPLAAGEPAAAAARCARAS